jgi:hypothetical protein
MEAFAGDLKEKIYYLVEDLIMKKIVKKMKMMKE